MNSFEKPSYRINDEGFPILKNRSEQPNLSAEVILKDGVEFPPNQFPARTIGELLSPPPLELISGLDIENPISTYIFPDPERVRKILRLQEMAEFSESLDELITFPQYINYLLCSLPDHLHATATYGHPHDLYIIPKENGRLVYLSDMAIYIREYPAHTQVENAIIRNKPNLGPSESERRACEFLRMYRKKCFENFNNLSVEEQRYFIRLRDYIEHFVVYLSNDGKSISLMHVNYTRNELTSPISVLSICLKGICFFMDREGENTEPFQKLNEGVRRCTEYFKFIRKCEQLGMNIKDEGFVKIAPPAYALYKRRLSDLFNKTRDQK